MKKILFVAALAWVGAVVAGGWAPKLLQSIPEFQPLLAQTESAALSGEAAQYRAMLDQYCVGCHNSRLAQPTAVPVNLESVDMNDLLADAETWERVVRKLSRRAMPPQGMPRPDEANYTGFTNWLTTSLDRASAELNNPGSYVVHRLNRTEYSNAIRDLLALEVDVTELLPSDGGDFGFDNIATALNTSPLLLERYLTAALRISAAAVGDTAVSPGTTEYPIALTTTQKDYVPGLPLGTRGGVVVKHIFPADAEYVLGGRLNRTILNGYAGVAGQDVPNTFVVTIDGEQVFSVDIGGPEDHALVQDDQIALIPVLEERMKGEVFVTAGQHEVGFTWIDRPYQEQGVWQPTDRQSQEVHMTGGLPRLRTVSVEGPYNVTGISSTPSRELLFVCEPTAGAEAACAEEILTNLAQRAYRRPVTADDLEAPTFFFEDALENGGDFDAGIRAGVSRILASPSFLYRIERDAEGVEPGEAHQISDLDLASRLSFFLWSSIPDEELLDLAIAGRLRAPGVLDAQVRRMVSDERSEAFIEDFVGQWLRLRNLEARVQPDLLMFPHFDDNLRNAFRTETEMFFGYLVRENMSALDLIDADFTFVNERLAKHYGIDGVYGQRFRQVTLEDQNRRGLLGQGSVLSLTSVANRTSPVLRGVYILQTFLNTPPLPPPPSVPTLDESAGTREAPRTVRQQMEVHRANPVCASCHSIIDPVGFALENFDTVGQWRDVDLNGAAIDTSGVLADGAEVNGPGALRDAILSRPDAFAVTLTERLMTYALGRGIEPADMGVVRSVVRNAAQDDYRLMTIISGIVESAPFQMRTKLAPTGANEVVAQIN